MVRLIKTFILILCSTFLLAQPLTYDAKYIHISERDEWVALEEQTTVYIQDDELTLAGEESYTKLLLSEFSIEEDYKRTYAKMVGIDFDSGEEYKIILFFPESDGVFWKLLIRGSGLDVGFLIVQDRGIW